MFAMIVELDEQGGDRVFCGYTPQECWDEFVATWRDLVDRNWEFTAAADWVEFYEFSGPVRVIKTTSVSFMEG